MFPRSQPFALSSSGDAHAGDFEDISTRTLQSVRVGQSAGKLSSGSGNAFVGYEAGKTNVQGNYNAMVGYQAGAQNANASYATMVGAYAGAQNQRGSEVTFVGFKAGELSRDGNQLVGVGAFALRENVSGNGTVAIGYRSAERTLDGYFNTMIGTESGQDNRSGNYNTMAGYRSGRAAFLGNENTYLGAFSGYSNRRGSGNSFVGYRAGEELQNGDLNVAIGAYAMQFASSGSCNIAIGPYAGGKVSGGASENVLIGTNVASQGSPNRSVVLGALAGSTMSGNGSVLIGYQAGIGLELGNCNILIGTGATSFSPSNNLGIAIGSFQTLTYTNSLSIGNSVTNQREYSVLVGNSVSSDADNSIIIGKTNTIQSFVVWKDPISTTLQQAVLNDGQSKLGLCNIEYSDTVISPCNEIYPTAVAKIFTSNLVSSLTNPPRGQVGPSTYDLRQYVPEHIFHSGLVIAARNSNEYAQKNALSFATGNTIISSSKPTFVSPPQVLLQDIQNLTSTTGIASLQSHSGESNIAVNVRSLSNAFAYVPITCVLHHAPPLLTSNLAQSSLYASALSNIQYGISLSNTFTIPVTCNVEDVYIYDSASNQLRYVVEQTPQFGSLNHAIYTSLNNITYTPYAECSSTMTDQFVLRPHYFIKDGAYEYGIRSDDTCTVKLQLSPSDLIAPNYAILSNMVYVLDSNVIRKVPDISSNTYVNVMYMPPNFVLYTPIQATPYTFNDILRSVTCNVYDYTPEAYGSYLQTINTQFSNVLIMEQQYASNLCYKLNDVITFSMQLAAELTLPEEVSVVNDISDIAQALVQLVQEAPPTILSSNATIYLSSKVEEWTTLYDSFPYEHTWTNLIVDSNQSWYDNYLTSGVYDAWQNTFYASNQFANNLGNANLLSNITADYQANVASSISFDPYISAAATNIYPSFNTIFRSYFRERRIFITYEDLYGGEVYFASNLDNTATDPQAFDIRVGGITKRILIQMEGLPNNVWSNIEWSQSNGLQLRLPFSSNVETTPLDFSVYDGYSTHYVLKQPTIGRVQQGNYISRYPWSSNDQFHLVLKNTNGNTVDLPVYITYDVGSVFSPITLIQPPDDTQITTSVNYRSYGTISNTFSVSNITQHTRFYNDVQVLNDLNIQHITNYNPSAGYAYVHSNEVITSVITPLSTFGNITYTCNLSTQRFTYDSLSSVWTENPLTTIVIQEEVPQVDILALASNIEYNYLLTTISSNYFAFNSNTYVVERDDFIVQHNGLIKDNYLYSTSQVDVLRSPAEKEFFSTLTLATTSTLSSNIYYVSARSNIISRESVVPLTKHHIALNGYNQIQFNTGTTPSPYTIVQSNIGPVSQCTYASILQNQIYVKWATNEAQPQQPLPDLTTSIDNLQVTMAYGSAAIVNVFPPISKAFAIDTVIPAPIDDVIYACERRFSGAFTPLMIHVHNIQSGYISRDGSHIATQCPWSSRTELVYIPSPNSTNDVIELFFSGVGDDVTNVFSIPIYINFTSSSFGQVINMGINTQLIKNSLSPRNFFHSFNNLSLANIGIEPLGTSLTNVAFRRRVGTTWVTISTFTMQDVVNGLVYVIFTTNALQSTIQYSVYSGSTTLGPNRTFTFYRLDHVAQIPGTINLYNPTFELSCIGESPTNYKNTLEDTVRVWYTTLTSYDAEVIQPSTIEVRIYEQPRHGILVHTNSPMEIVGKCTLLEILLNKLRYVSHNPYSISEDYVELHLILPTNEMSPRLRLHVRHFYSHFAPYAINTAFVLDSQRLLQIPPTSISMDNDNLVWRSASGTMVPFNNATSTATAQSTYQTLWNLPPYNNGSNATWTVYTYSSHGHIDIPTATTTLYVDQADNISFASLSNYIPVNHAYTLDMYILSPPRWGSILNKNTALITNKYSVTEVLNGDVIYQHIGVHEPSTDSFSISFASSPYTLAYNTINVVMIIRPIPVVATNVNKYVYYDTYAQSNTVQRFEPSSLSFIGAGYVHVLSETNLKTVDLQNTHIVSFHTYQSNVHGFSITSNVFAQYPYPASSFQFTMNTHPEYYVNSLYTYTPYRDVFTNSYTSFTNQHTDSNIILAEVNRNQVIAYDVDNTPAVQSALLDKIITLAFELYPEASYYHPQFDLFLTDAFTLTLFSATGYLLRFYVYNRTWTLELEDGSTYTGVVPTSLTRNAWNTFKVVNFDPRNDNQLSIYWKYQSNDEVNLVEQLNIAAIGLERCVRYEFLVDVENPIAYTSSSNYVKQLASGLRIQFALYNSHLSYRIRNFQVNVSTYNVNDNLEYDPDSHNIIIGKDINVQGVNNICMGNRFVTSGNQSIIVGNNIGGGLGQTVTSVNDIFQSIVLGNESFRNSIVRDIICIGNNNFNNLSEQDAQKTRLFFAQKPIVIGNSVDASKIDYNINIGNVFLNTTISSKQVYLGHGGECVGIGYTTNEALSASRNKLYVAGNVKTDAVVANQYTRSVICPYDVAPYNVLNEVDENDNAIVCTTQMNTLVCGVAKESYVRLDGQYDVVVTTQGKTKVWCKGAVQPGELLSSDDFGCVVSRGTDTVKHSFTFAKSLSAWDPNNPFATPSVTTSNIVGYGDVGLISCIVMI